MVIPISGLVKGADTSDQGNVVFAPIKQALERNQVVSISFAGIDTVTSSFVNAALFPLTKDIPVSELKRRLRIVDSTRQINDMIRRCFETYRSISAA